MNEADVNERHVDEMSVFDAGIQTDVLNNGVVEFNCARFKLRIFQCLHILMKPHWNAIKPERKY